jgi:peptidase MA superfamily protein
MFRLQEAQSRSHFSLLPRHMLWVVAVAGMLSAPSRVEAAGFVHSPNFIVFTPPIPSQESADVFAKALLEKAEQYRKQIAIEWLGEELPPSVGQAMVTVSFSNERDSGLTWAKDRPNRKLHVLFLVTAPEQMPDGLLAHEMTHCVLATRFPHPHRLPAWLEEGIASRYDDAPRKAVRQKIMQWFVSTGHWPRLASVLQADNVHSDDQEAYALSATVTDMLLARGNKSMLLQFGQLAEQAGLERALSQCYGIQDLAELEAAWRTWVTATAQVSTSVTR